MVFKEGEGFSEVNDSILPLMVGVTCLLAFFLISGEGRNRVKTLEWEALLKMTISLVLKLGHMLVSSGEFWGKKTLMPETYPRDADLNRYGVWPGHLEF